MDNTNKNRQADGQRGEHDVEEQRVEGCERLGQGGPPNAGSKAEYSSAAGGDK